MECQKSSGLISEEQPGKRGSCKRKAAFSYYEKTSGGSLRGAPATPRSFHYSRGDETINMTVTMKQQLLFHYPGCRNPLHGR